jgi:UMF1 family MFS transporter
VARTIREARRHPDLFLFLTAFWLYNDGIASVIVMAVAFGREIGIGQGHLIGAILAVQFVGMPFAILFGRLSGWIGAKKSIMVGLGIYCLIVTGGYFITTPLHFWILALLVATAQGGTQALSRSLFARMAPAGRGAEFFGFYDVSAKFASIMGPFLFSTIAIMTGSSRNGILALLILFLLGGGLLSAVNVERGSGESAES